MKSLLFCILTRHSSAAFELIWGQREHFATEQCKGLRKGEDDRSVLEQWAKRDRPVEVDSGLVVVTVVAVVVLVV